MDKAIQLFILPFAGGTAASFKMLEKLLDDKIDVYTVEYPGHGKRASDHFCKSFDELLDDVAYQIKEQRIHGLPFSLMGYSMGVEAAFDLAQYKLDEQADHLFFCARDTISLNTKGHDYALLDSERFSEKIAELGGVDRKIIQNKRFRDIYIKPVYEDYKLIMEYEYHPERGLLNNNLTIMYCEKDTPWKDIMGWEKITTGKTYFFEMGDNHFFINDCTQKMADIINTALI
ncbi:MAG: thioesterase domain-containing protein [Lachnospiraceae bacterium]|nr:thioesterase domain-containing protein [Lachnospiraceae bacterium]